MKVDYVERLRHIVGWFELQSESLSLGLKNQDDALRLYEYWVKHDDKLPSCDSDEAIEFRVKALGYDPMGDEFDYVSRKAKIPVIKGMRVKVLGDKLGVVVAGSKHLHVCCDGEIFPHVYNPEYGIVYYAEDGSILSEFGSVPEVQIN